MSEVPDRGRITESYHASGSRFRWSRLHLSISMSVCKTDHPSKCVALSGLRKRESFLSNLSSTILDSRVFEQVPNVETIIGQFILPSRVLLPQRNQKLKVQLMYVQTSILISRSAIVMRTVISFHCHFKRPTHFSHTRKPKTEALHALE